MHNFAFPNTVFDFRTQRYCTLWPVLCDWDCAKKQMQCHATSVFASFRVPATPIWVHSPYVNWLLPADNPTDAWVQHVRNDKVGSLTALVRVDEKTFTLLGPLPTLCPSGPLRALPLPSLGPALILPTRTIYNFRGAGIEVNLTFASPKFIEDLESYIPVLLIETSVAFTDGLPHTVQVFIELTGQVAVDTDSTNVSWARDEPQVWDAASPGTHGMRIYNPEGVGLRMYHPYNPATATGGQPVEHLDWGAAHLTLLPPVEAQDPPASWMGSSNVRPGRDSNTPLACLTSSDEFL